MKSTAIFLIVGILLTIGTQYIRANYHASLYAGDGVCERHISWSKELWHWDIFWTNCFTKVDQAIDIVRNK